MFDRRPREGEWLSWLWVGIWTALIYATIPFARAIQSSLSERWGRSVFTWIVLFAVAAGAVAAFRSQRGTGSPGIRGPLWLAAVAALFCAYTIRLANAPEEALHFVQYGILGVLLYRAFCHRVRDASVYIQAAAVGVALGTLDEAIQWATPRRYWALSDIWLNAFAASLVLVGIARGLRPRLVSKPVGASSVRRSYALILAAVVLLFSSVLNTPIRIHGYAERLPWLSFLAESGSVMLEYGHLYRDPTIGRFRSRLTPAELQRQDETRSLEVARILDAYPDRAAYQRFLEIYTPVTDPFVHEARVHLFRRDRYLARALDDEDGDGDGVPRQTPVRVALGENRILERYLPHTLAASSYRLSDETRSWLESWAPDELEYDSRVSRDLVTQVSETQVVVGFAVLFSALWTARWLHLRRLPRVAGTPS